MIRLEAAKRMDKISQNKQLDLLQTKKTVDWLVNNTSVNVFNPINFTGYQRQIDNKHCSKIADYLKQDFFLPTAIICSTDKEYTENSKLRIVDGQHRVKAFKMLQLESPVRYTEIKDYEIPVIVLAKVDENTEIDTFITINKTSKKVDTSLALVLKNKMNKYNTSGDLTMPRAEYVAVELAQILNFREDSNNIWFDKILFEKKKKNTLQIISLNAFVKSTRVLLNQMAKKHLISLDWKENTEITNCIEMCYKIITHIWMIVQNRWPDLFNSDLEKRRIIQGAIGYSSFNKVIIELLGKKINDKEFDLIKSFEDKIRNLSIESEKWLPGGPYSKYSSESGYSIVAREILDDMNM